MAKTPSRPAAARRQPPAKRAPKAERQQAQLQPPSVGALWPGQGGIYVGLIQGQGVAEGGYHLVLATEMPAEHMRFAEAKAWAEAYVAEDLSADFALPDATESALLYRTLRGQFRSSDWYWTSTEQSELLAIGQYFLSDGLQRGNNKSHEACVCAVRRVPS